MTERTILVVGASRGLGLGLVRDYLDGGWRVIATTRRPSEPLSALAAGAGGRLRLETLDVTDAGGIPALARALAGTRLDVLFVSAGTADGARGTAADIDPGAFAGILHTNALAPLKIIEALGALVPTEGAIVAMSSVLGSVAQNTRGGNDVYRASKAALNTLLRSYAVRHPDRALIAMHPGWVRTDMGGAHADVAIDDSVAGMIGVIDAYLGKPGCIFLDYQGATIAW